MSIKDEESIRLWDSGLTMTEIGQRVGLSRERIRQRLKAHGRSGPNRNGVPTADEIRAAIREELSLQHVARLLRTSVERLVRGIARAGMEDEVDAAFAASSVLA